LTGTPDPLADGLAGALVDALVDLGRHLDVHPSSHRPESSNLTTRVLDRIEGLAPPEGSSNMAVLPPDHRRLRRPRMIGVAAAVAVLLAVVVVMEPTREAIAGWFGIGAVRLEQVDGLVTPDPTAPRAIGPPGSTTGTLTEPHGHGTEPADSDEPTVAAQLAAAETRLAFPIHLPDTSVTGRPLRVTVDPAVATGLVEITYRDFTLVEVASLPGELPPLTKLMPPGATIRNVSVGTYPALWISGTPHELTYIRPDGTFATDDVRRAGNVLLWEAGGITHRLEGLASLEGAQLIAATMP